VNEPAKPHAVPSIAPAWGDATEAEVRELVESLLRDCDRFVIIGIRRVSEDPGATTVTGRAFSRGSRTSACEMIGAVYWKLHDWLGEL
jgi:hypothetical protein